MADGLKYKWTNWKNAKFEIVINWLKRRTETISLNAFGVKNLIISINCDSNLTIRNLWLSALFTNF